MAASLCQFDHRIRTVPFENSAYPLHEIWTQFQNCDTSEGTLVTPACDKTRRDDDPVAQVEPCFLDWVDEFSQVGGTIRSGKAIGVTPSGRCRVPAFGNCETSGQLQSIS